MHQRLDGVDVAVLCKGDKQAWDAFVPLAAALVKAVARRVLAASGHEHETSDVMQEVFVRLSKNEFRLLREFDVQRARLSTWLGVIASAAAVDCLRRKHRGEVALDEQPEEALGSADAPQLSRLRLPDNLLSPRQALILSLLYEKDMTPDEVALALRIEVQTVRSQRHKAFIKLRAVWGDRLHKPKTVRQIEEEVQHGN